MRKSVRVVFVTTVFEEVNTGPGIYARYLWEAFGDDPEIEFHIVVPEATQRHPGLHVAGKSDNSLLFYRRVQDLGLQIAHEHGLPTIVHGNSAHSMGRFVGYEGPLLVQVNDYEPATLPDHPVQLLRQRGPRRVLALAWRRTQERRVLRYASLAICNSQHTAAEVRRAYSLSPERIQVVYKAVSTAAFEKPRTLPDDPLRGRAVGSRLVFVGTDWKRKGLDVLLDAMSSLAANQPDLVLSVLGPDPGDAELCAAIRKRGLESQVILFGRASSAMIARVLWHSDVFVLPSRQEALGVAVLEAMAAEVPVVATRVGGIPEIIVTEDCGVLVPPEDGRALAAAIAQLLADEPRRHAISVAARRRAGHFSVPAMTRKLRDIYLEIAGARRAPIH